MRASTARASAGVRMSPLAITGMRTLRFTAAMVWYSACPAKPQARVRPWTASSCTPESSAMRAMRTAFLRSGLGPVRILRVTGTCTAATTASRMRATRSSSASSAEPA